MFPKLSNGGPPALPAKKKISVFKIFAYIMSLLLLSGFYPVALKKNVSQLFIAYSSFPSEN